MEQDSKVLSKVELLDITEIMKGFCIKILHFHLILADGGGAFFQRRLAISSCIEEAYKKAMATKRIRSTLIKFPMCFTRFGSKFICVVFFD